MVDGIFYIRGESIFDVGLRFSLVELAAEYNIQAKAVNQRNEKSVQIIVSGSRKNIESFHYYVSKNDVRFFKQPSNLMYQVSDMGEYHGPAIDFYSYRQSLITAQLGKILYTADNMLPTTKATLEEVNENIKDIKDDIGSTLKDIGNTLRDISKNLANK